MSGGRPLSRRTVLVGGLGFGGLGLGLAGCRSGGAGAPAADGAPGTPGSPGAREPSDGLGPTSPGTPANLPRPSAWQPRGAEKRPELKVLAARVVEALSAVAEGTAPVGAAALSAAGSRLRAVGADARLAEAAATAIPPGSPAVGQVIYPQYGGLLDDAASVMVVVQQTWRAEDVLQTRQIVVDVRLAYARSGWRVSELRPAVGAAVAPDTAPAAVGALLRMPTLSLPGPAQQDLLTVAQPKLIDMLTRLAAGHELSVSTLRSGHPRQVFGTTGDSNHWRGLAVDVWAFDGTAVVERAPDDPALLALLQEARSLGLTEVGSPTDPDGKGKIFFANALHRDHIHLAFDPVK